MRNNALFGKAFEIMCKIKHKNDKYILEGKFKIAFDKTKPTEIFADHQ
ncbi:hypothetical protein [Flavobacterium sp. DG2-3]|nr:hypothetical protein [Flavobacterium sp. DG2-3]MDP5198296.1 hypothetical protein [Flavobacterium sp. DG2-3]